MKRGPASPTRDHLERVAHALGALHEASASAADFHQEARDAFGCDVLRSPPLPTLGTRALSWLADELARQWDLTIPGDPVKRRTGADRLERAVSR